MKIRIKPWQIVVLVAPILLIVGFLLVAAGQQIRTWGLNWIWGVVVFVLLGWRWLLVTWTRPAIAQAEAIVSEVTAELDAATKAAEENLTERDRSSQDRVNAAVTNILTEAQNDPPIWDDWTLFWQRCLALVTAISQVYHPEVKRPLLNIYVPEAYGLIRGTVDDTDRMMQKLTPILGQVSIGQMVEGVEVYRRLEPSAKKVIKAFRWAQWALNPVAAIARQTSAKYTSQANQQIILNLSNLLRESALRNLAQQSVALYGGGAKVILEEVTAEADAIAPEKTQTLSDILATAQPAEPIQQKPVNILLVGRTGAGKSSVINTLFRSEQAAVDVLPSTDNIQSYRWQLNNATDSATDSAADIAANSATGNASDAEALVLWDTPGYEQANRADFRAQVLDYAKEADLLLLVTPALDPALQVDADFLRDLGEAVPDLPAIATVTQVDKLRPIREWSPPYHWRTGSWPKEMSIREAVNYRVEQFGALCQTVLPLVTRMEDGSRAQMASTAATRMAWGDEDLAAALLDAIAPAKQLRLARFLRNRETRTVAAAKIIDRYAFQMTTTEGLAKLLKSPILQFISTLTTGNPALGAILTQKIPVEDAPVVLGKLQMAYELFTLMSDHTGWSATSKAGFDLLALWPFLLRNTEQAADKQAWALGQALVEYWTQTVTVTQIEARIDHYLAQPGR
ncbi:MAG: GTPase family protein [Phormidesmis sp.]